MAESSWLAAVIGLAGVVAIVLTALVISLVKPGRRSGSTSARSRPGSPVQRSGPSARSRRSGSPFSGLGRPRGHRSVEGNMERAFVRIDAVDPYAVQRRIGEALVDAGLVSSTSVFDDPPLPEDRRRSGDVTDRTHRWEDEA